MKYWVLRNPKGLYLNREYRTRGETWVEEPRLYRSKNAAFQSMGWVITPSMKEYLREQGMEYDDSWDSTPGCWSEGFHKYFQAYFALPHKLKLQLMEQDGYEFIEKEVTV